MVRLLEVEKSIRFQDVHMLVSGKKKVSENIYFFKNTNNRVYLLAYTSTYTQSFHFPHTHTHIFAKALDLNVLWRFVTNLKMHS